MGKTELLKQILQIRKDVVSKYLAVLQDLSVIERLWPVTEDPKSRKGIYRIKDNYFKFYFRFIFPNLEYIEIGETDFLLEKIKENFNSYLGQIFESVLLEIFRTRRDLLPFKPTKIGKWWGKEQEIDIIAIDEKYDKILFVEVKYTSKKAGNDLYIDLIEKAKTVKWRNKTRKEYYMLVSKVGFERNLEGKNVTCLGLDALNQVESKTTH